MTSMRSAGRAAFPRKPSPTTIQIYDPPAPPSRDRGSPDAEPPSPPSPDAAPGAGGPAGAPGSSGAGGSSGMGAGGSSGDTTITGCAIAPDSRTGPTGIGGMLILSACVALARRGRPRPL